MRKSVIYYQLLILLILAISCTAVSKAASKLPENKPLQDLTKVVIEDLKDTYYLGPIGARGWIQKISTIATPDDFEGFFSNDIARQILITAVEKGSPADGVLQVGDVILGTGNKPFSSNARKAIADAIDVAEKEENNGILRLLRWRPDVADKEGATVRSKGKSKWVELKLKVMGTYSDTAPYNCPKSEAIVKQTAEKIIKSGKFDYLHIDALSLLATGEKKYIPVVKDYIDRKKLADPNMKLTVETARSSSSWYWSYAAILLSEYHFITGDKTVLPAIEEYAVNIAKGQSIAGNWGHKMADYAYNDGKPHGRLTGYSALNQPGITCFMAMNFAVKCGIKHPELDYAIEHAGNFFGYFAEKGAVPYGHDHPLEYMLTNNGTSATAAIAFALKGDKNRAKFFSSLCAAGHVKTEVGHTGTFFNTFWTPLGANLSGPETTAEFFKQHRWIHTLARRWDGGFVYQPPGGRFGGSKESYYGLSSNAAHLMFYAIPLRKLYITGKDPDKSLWLTGKKAEYAVKASLIDYKKRTDERLIKLLAHPVPMVRRQAADELGTRKGDFVQPLRKMLKTGKRNAKVGAAHGLAAIKEKAGPAVDDLVAVIADPKQDLWVRNRAAAALSSIGKPAVKAFNDLLKISLTEKKQDLRGDLDKEIAIALSKLAEDPYKLDLDKDLFYKAVKKMLGHSHHVARRSAMKLVSNIPLKDFHIVAGSIIEVIRCSDTGYETYHNDADRAAGLAILESLNIDAIDLCLETLETNKWGQKWRVTGKNGRLATLVRYKANSKRVLPKLKEMRNGKSPLGKLGASADEFIKAIEESTETRKLMSIEEAIKASLQMSKSTVHEADVVVYGDASGGVTAAVQAARMGKKVILVSQYGHLGGMTSSGLGWTDIGSTAILGGLSKEFYHRVYMHYQNPAAWNHQPRDKFQNKGQGAPALNPKTQLASTFEPKVAEAVFDAMVKEVGVKIIKGRLDLDKGAVKSKAKITAIRLEGGVLLKGKMFIDASYEGDLLAAAGVTFTVGRESNSEYNETGNGITGPRHGNQLRNGIDPYVIKGDASSGLLKGVNPDMGGNIGDGDHRLQAYCYRMVLTDVPANRVAIPKPEGYDETDYEILFRSIEVGQKGGFFKTTMVPNRKTDANNASGISCDFIGGNYGKDWNWATLNHKEREKLADKHRNWQFGLVWTLQNHPRVPKQIRDSISVWGLAKDEFKYNNNWPYNLYIREARRMKSAFVMTEDHCRNKLPVDDSVGMGAYTLDSHNVQRFVHNGMVKNEGDIQAGLRGKPYGISYRSIVPRQGECENLLVPWALSSTHIAFGSIRMEPVFMVLGQSAATAACIAIDDDISVQAVEYEKLRKHLIKDDQRIDVNPKK